MTANSSPSALDALIGGGVITKVAIDGAVVAPLTNTTKQIILDFEGATWEYVAPGSGQAVGTIKITPGGGSGGVPATRNITLATTALIFSDADATDLNHHDLSHDISIQTVPANEFDEGTMSAADKSKSDNQLSGTNAHARLEGSASSALRASGIDAISTDGSVAKFAVTEELWRNEAGIAAHEGAFEFVARIAFWTPNNTPIDFVFGESRWGGQGTTDATIYGQTARIAIEITGQTHGGQNYSTAWFGLLRKGLFGGSAGWSISQGLAENTVFRIPPTYDPTTDNGGCLVSMSLGGTNNGDLTFEFGPTGSSGDSNSAFLAKITIIGGGRYA